MIIILEAFVVTAFCLLLAATIVSFIAPHLAKRVKWIDLSDDNEQKEE